MSALVQRLNVLAAYEDETGAHYSPEVPNPFREAADRIEKLEAALRLARNRLQMAAINATAAGESDAYDYQDWANEANAALSTREGLSTGREEG